VFGDIGTSPLYTMKECAIICPPALSVAGVLGILSLMLWALVLVVRVKYLLFVTKADNEGGRDLPRCSRCCTGLRRPRRRGMGAVIFILIGAPAWRRHHRQRFRVGSSGRTDRDQRTVPAAVPRSLPRFLPPFSGFSTRVRGNRECVWSVMVCGSDRSRCSASGTSQSIRASSRDQSALRAATAEASADGNRRAPGCVVLTITGAEHCTPTGAISGGVTFVGVVWRRISTGLELFWPGRVPALPAGEHESFASRHRNRAADGNLVRGRDHRRPGADFSAYSLTRQASSSAIFRLRIAYNVEHSGQIYVPFINKTSPSVAS
jgi:hypothetical protein